MFSRERKTRSYRISVVDMLCVQGISWLAGNMGLGSGMFSLMFMRGEMTLPESSYGGYSHQVF